MRCSYDFGMSRSFDKHVTVSVPSTLPLSTTSSVLRRTPNLDYLENKGGDSPVSLDDLCVTHGPQDGTPPVTPRSSFPLSKRQFGHQGLPPVTRTK